MEKIEPCPVCKTAKHVKVEPQWIGFVAFCDNCYDCDCVGDPAQFVSLRPIYHGHTEAEALNGWNENMRDEDGRDA